MKANDNVEGKALEEEKESKAERTRKVAAIPAKRISPSISSRRFGFRPRRQFV